MYACEGGLYGYGQDGFELLSRGLFTELVRGEKEGVSYAVRGSVAVYGAAAIGREKERGSGSGRQRERRRSNALCNCITHRVQPNMLSVLRLEMSTTAFKGRTTENAQVYTISAVGFACMPLTR